MAQALPKPNQVKLAIFVISSVNLLTAFQQCLYFVCLPIVILIIRNFTASLNCYLLIIRILTKCKSYHRKNELQDINFNFKFYFQILGILCMACCGPAYWSTQHWFLLVVVLAFLGSVFYSLYYLCLDVYLKGFNVNWLQSVRRYCKGNN